MGVPRHTSRPGVGTAELRASRLATWLMNYLADQRGTRTMRIRERVLELARQLWIRYSDPIVRIEVSGSYLLMPLSHELPMYMKRFPLYSQAVGRIAGYLAEASRTPITMVDIGANIGDTAAIVRSYCEIPVLCVEGHPRYCEILRRNVTFVGADIAMSSTFVGSGDVDVAGSWEYGHGTAKFIEGGGERVRARSLSSVLRDHSAFRQPRLVKLDTDGYDCAIVLAELPALAALRPVLFFEYDPSILSGPADLPTMATALGEIGYSDALIYDNLGYYMGRLPLSDMPALEALDAYVGSMTTNAGYVDICVFHAVDSLFALDVHRREVDYLKAHLRQASRRE